MECLGYESGATGWQAQTKPRSYGGHPINLLPRFLKIAKSGHAVGDRPIRGKQRKWRLKTQLAASKKQLGYFSAQLEYPNAESCFDSFGLKYFNFNWNFEFSSRAHTLERYRERDRVKLLNAKEDKLMKFSATEKLERCIFHVFRGVKVEAKLTTDVMFPYILGMFSKIEDRNTLSFGKSFLTTE